MHALYYTNNKTTHIKHSHQSTTTVDLKTLHPPRPFTNTQALDGQYVLPGAGGDPIRNPNVLPTGRNIHALDPQSIPTSAALQSAKVVVERLLERQRVEAGGVWPETVAMVLWGTDNIKTYGESLAQVCCYLCICRGWWVVVHQGFV